MVSRYVKHVSVAVLAGIIGPFFSSMPVTAGLLGDVRSGNTRTIVTMGTSLTAPAGGNWVAQMETWLKGEAPDPGNVSIVNVAVSGNASTHGVQSHLPNALAADPDVVFIEYINDAYAPYNISQQDSVDNFNTIIDSLEANNPGVEVIIMVMNNVGNRWASSYPDLAAYYERHREVAAARGLLLIDHYPNWTNLYSSDLTTWNSYVPDNIHPNSAGAQNIIVPEIQRALEEDETGPQVTSGDGATNVTGKTGRPDVAKAMSDKAASEPGPLQVFVLVGQSNMLDPGRHVHMRKLLADWRSMEEFWHLRTGDDWREWDDVWVKFWDAKGNLSVTSLSASGIGPEMGFGYVVGSALERQVLIIKVAWSGQSLGRDFRPPSSGVSDAQLQPTLDKLNAKSRRRKKPEMSLEAYRNGCGLRYRQMLEEVKSVLGDIKAVFPEYDAEKGYRLAGMVWFQGWNDMSTPGLTDEYQVNMVNFIKDVRKDLGVPNLPFVIGETGMGGVEVMPRWADIHYSLRKAQKGAADMPEFKGTTAFVETAAITDAGRASTTQTYDGSYHYFGHANTYYRIGDSFGRAMLTLLNKTPAPSPRDADMQARIDALRAMAASDDPKALEGLLAAACAPRRKGQAYEKALHKAMATDAFIEHSLTSKAYSADQLAGFYARALETADRHADRQALLAGLGKIHSLDAMQVVLAYLGEKEVANEAYRALVVMAGALVVDHRAEVKTVMAKLVNGDAPQDAKRRAELILNAIDNPNLARVARISNPEGYKQTHRGYGGPTIAVAIDGDMETRWVPEGGKPLYRVVVELDQPREVGSIRIHGYKGNRLTPKDFDILCDGKVVREVRDLESKQAQSGIDFPVTKCKTLQLNITDSYHGAPGIRELEVYGGEGN